MTEKQTPRDPAKIARGLTAGMLTELRYTNFDDREWAISINLRYSQALERRGVLILRDRGRYTDQQLTDFGREVAALLPEVTP